MRTLPDLASFALHCSYSGRSRTHVAVNDWLVTRSGDGHGGNPTRRLRRVAPSRMPRPGKFRLRRLFRDRRRRWKPLSALHHRTGSASARRHRGSNWLVAARTASTPPAWAPARTLRTAVFSGVFLDDCIAIHGSFARVTGVDGGTLKLEGPAGDFKAGEPLRVSDTQRVLSPSPLSSSRFSRWVGAHWLATVDPAPDHHRLSRPTRAFRKAGNSGQ